MDNEEVSGERTHQEIPISEGIVDHKVDSDNTNSDEEVSEEVTNKVDELDVSEKITPVDQSSVNHAVIEEFDSHVLSEQNWTPIKGPSIKDVRKILAILDPSPLVREVKPRYVSHINGSE